MSNYSQRSDLENTFSQANIHDWADKDRSGDLSRSELDAIDAALTAAQAIVDGHLIAAGYCAPFEGQVYASLSGQVKALLCQWTVSIAAYHIHSWQGLRDHEHALENIYKQTLEQLKSVASSTALSDAPKRNKVSSSADNSQNSSADSLYMVRSDGWDW